MSLFNVKDIDRLLLSFCDLLDDYIVIMLVNKYYHALVSNDILFISFKNTQLACNEMVDIHFIRKTGYKYYTKLFLVACARNNLLLCEYLNNYKGNKFLYSVREVDFIKCYYKNVEVAKFLLTNKKISFNCGSLNIYYIFSLCCYEGYTATIKWMVDTCQLLSIDLRPNTYLFSECCRRNKLETAKYLYQLDPLIASDCEDIFLSCCAKGRLEMARWLYGLNINPDIEEAFRVSYDNGCIEVCDWLLEMSRTPGHVAINVDFYWFMWWVNKVYSWLK